jgi:hypothetical protein
MKVLSASLNKRIHFLHLWIAPSGAPASEPSPHLISTEEGAVVLLLDDFGFSVQNSMAAVLRLEIESSRAMRKLGFMT